MRLAQCIGPVIHAPDLRFPFAQSLPPAARLLQRFFCFQQICPVDFCHMPAPRPFFAYLYA